MKLTYATPPWLAQDQPPITTETALEYRIYHTFQEAAHLAAQWNDLSRRVSDLYSSYDWCHLWWKQFGRWRQLEIHTLQGRDGLLAVLPLFRETIYPLGLWLRTVRVLGSDYTISMVGLCAEPAYAERFMRMVLDGLNKGPSWDYLHIGPVRSYTPAMDPATSACIKHSDIQTTILGRQDGWNTRFELPGSYEAFLALLSSNARNDTRRRERRLNQQHRVEIQTVTDAKDVDAAMDALIDLHQNRWTSQGRPGQLHDPQVKQFHRDVAHELAKRGDLVLLTIKADDTVVAATYGYRHGARVHGLMRGQVHGAPWDDYSLGRIMHCHLIRHAIEMGCTMLEDGRGIFDYKTRLGGQLYGERSLIALRSGWTRRLRYWSSLRAAYAVHILYSRIWIDMIAPHLPIHPKHRRFYRRNVPLRDMMRTVPLPLFGKERVLELRCLENPKHPATD